MHTKSKARGKVERLSPYARKRRLGLVPMQYSTEYRSWCAAVARGDDAAIHRADYQHRQMLQRRYG